MANGEVERKPKWNVVGVNPTVSVETGGIPVKGNQVTYVTALGHRGQVFVPDTIGSLDAASELIAAAAAHTDGLATLKG